MEKQLKASFASVRNFREWLRGLPDRRCLFVIGELRFWNAPDVLRWADLMTESQWERLPVEEILYQEEPERHTEEVHQLRREQADTINIELSSARDALYRATEVLSASDPSLDKLFGMAGLIEDEKVALLKRCEECGKRRR